MYEYLQKMNHGLGIMVIFYIHMMSCRVYTINKIEAYLDLFGSLSVARQSHRLTKRRVMAEPMPLWHRLLPGQGILLRPIPEATAFLAVHSFVSCNQALSVGSCYTLFLSIPILGMGSCNHKVVHPKKGIWYEPTSGRGIESVGMFKNWIAIEELSLKYDNPETIL